MQTEPAWVLAHRAKWTTIVAEWSDEDIVSSLRGFKYGGGRSIVEAEARRRNLYG